MTYDRLVTPARRTRPAGFVRGLLRMLALHRQRARLGQLDDRMLRDIGLTRHQACREAARPPWDVPAHWRGR